MRVRARLLIACLLVTGFSPAPDPAGTVAIIGATLIDTGDWGRSTRDVADGVVLIRGGRIVAAGPADTVAVPAGAERVDARGRFLIPGLIDGFSAQDDQGYANAHLAMGVTTIIVPPQPDERRGAVRHGEPEPTVMQLDDAGGYDLQGLPHPSRAEITGAGGVVAWTRSHARRMTNAELRANVDAAAWRGAAGVMLMYPLDDRQVRTAADEARRKGLFTIGELGHASYVAAAKAGVNSFIHVSRIELELAPPELRRKVADAPFAPARSPTAQAYNRFLTELDTTSTAFRRYAAALAASGTVLLPTLTIGAGFLPGSDNPWASPVGPLVAVHQIDFLPYDRTTGRPGVPPGAAPDYAASRARRAETAQREIGAFYAAGVHFLAGSGCDAFGVLPGWGLQREVRLLKAAGLSPREAVAAATGNYALAFGLKDRGRIAPGLRADLVLLDADPRQDVAALGAIREVWLNGERLDREKLLAWRPAKAD